MKEKKPPRGKYLYGTVKVGEKGQIVIPKEARDKHNITPGDTLMVMGNEKGIALLKNETFMMMIGRLIDNDMFMTTDDENDKDNDKNENKDSGNDGK